MKVSDLIVFVDMHESSASVRELKKSLLYAVGEDQEVEQVLSTWSDLVHKVAEALMICEKVVMKHLKDVLLYPEVAEEFPDCTEYLECNEDDEDDDDDSEVTDDKSDTSSDTSGDTSSVASSDATIRDPTTLKNVIRTQLTTIHGRLTSLEGMFALNMFMTMAAMAISFVGVAFTSKLMG